MAALSKWERLSSFLQKRSVLPFDAEDSCNPFYLVDWYIIFNNQMNKNFTFPFLQANSEFLHALKCLLVNVDFRLYFLEIDKKWCRFLQV